MSTWIINRFRRFVQLPAAEKRLLLEALGFHWAARLGLWLVPFRRISGFVKGLEENRQPVSCSMPTEVAAWAVAATTYLTPRATCLSKSLALQAMLRRRGRPAELRIGVAKSSGEPLEAHAWVELEGRTYLGGPGLERFAPMPKFDRGQ